MSLKPHRAIDLEEDKLRFPLITMPKIDGVRGVNLDGTIKQRTLKPIGNKAIVQMFSGELFRGMDGELAVAGQETHWDLCRLSGSLVRGGKHNRTDVEWHLFDYLHPAVISLPYIERLSVLQRHVREIQEHYNGTAGVARLRVVPHAVAHNLGDFLTAENSYIDLGYEGIVARDPNGAHKSGYSTLKSGGYLRRKPFVDFEGEVLSFTEAKENTNEAKINELGRSERSTHKAGMVPKAMIGNIQMRVLADLVYMRKTLLVKDQIVTVGPGKMPHSEREYFFHHPKEFISQIGTAKFFAHGQKEKPRMATWKCFRDRDDIILED